MQEIIEEVEVIVLQYVFLQIQHVVIFRLFSPDISDAFDSVHWFWTFFSETTILTRSKKPHVHAKIYCI